MFTFDSRVGSIIVVTVRTFDRPSIVYVDVLFICHREQELVVRLTAIVQDNFRLGSFLDTNHRIYHVAFQRPFDTIHLLANFD